ncbi:MAG: D-sedoheptulose 7-phosphate isomerase [Candidatus Omnitrophica bacterium]|nr:D-sedoheptulose 7-phosphate isomerase [Candidatus Omnitrophota bacterium]
MQFKLAHILEESIAAKREAFRSNHEKLLALVALLVDCLNQGGKILIFGNGGSAADSQHIAAEFIGRFQKERRALAAIALSTDTSILTALANDYTTDIIFSRQIEALGRPGDVVWGISTSGRSPNVVQGIETARRMGLKTVTFTGKDGGLLLGLSDLNINVPAAVTARVQESHICMAHAVCELVEDSIAAADAESGRKRT